MDAADDGTAARVAPTAGAGRDLRLLVDARLLEARGKRRGRFYVRAPRLVELDDRLRQRRPVKGEDDPFVLATVAVNQQRIWPSAVLDRR